MTPIVDSDILIASLFVANSIYRDQQLPDQYTAPQGQEQAYPQVDSTILACSEVHLPPFPLEQAAHHNFRKHGCYSAA